MDDFYAARSRTIPPLPWTNFAPPLSHAAPPRQKEAVLPEDLIAMLETLDRGTLRGLRDRSMLLLGFAGCRFALNPKNPSQQFQKDSPALNLRIGT